MPKKLIEVALPLDEINREASREKSIRHGHPSTLHLWWSRKPLAATRAVIWASLVDDPSAHPEKFPTEEDQKRERDRLHDILKRLVKWESSNDPDILREARDEMLASCGDRLPELLDPFAGGGSIPLEAARLGLVAHAHDLNPVAVMINKAMIEIPPRFAGNRPVNPDAGELSSREGAAGLADDVRYYGEWMKREAERRIGHLYPKVKLPASLGGREATVIAWLWTRTVRCANPACGCEMPLASSFVLSKKKGSEAYVVPTHDRARNTITYEVHRDKGTPPASPKASRGANFRCVVCGEPVGPEYVKDQFMNGHAGAQLMAIVAEGDRGRVYLSPDEAHIKAADVPKPSDVPTQKIPYDPRHFSTSQFGLETYDSLFTNRQLSALTTFSDLVAEAQARATEDAIAAGMANDGVGLADRGTGATAYGQAVGVYLAFLVSKLTDYHCSLAGWIPAGDKIGHLFSRQAIPMVWDFAEGNIFSNSSGSYKNMHVRIVECIQKLPAEMIGVVRQFDAQSDSDLRGIMVSTDPPYYDNISYADIADYFYVWLRRTLKDTYPKIFSTLVTPKNEELVVNPFRFDNGTDDAKKFFEVGMLEACKKFYLYAHDNYPITIYYAYKQKESERSSESDEVRVSSSGWETMLSAIINAGFCITGTWPMRTERSGRTNSMEANSLASSIVLVCRKRPADAKRATWRDFENALKRELVPALHTLQSTNIAPVDMAQCAIGPGMAVYSRYSQVLDIDGRPLSVRAALQVINQELDKYFNQQDSTLDAGSRFCVDLYTQDGFGVMRGDPDTLARARNTSPDSLRGAGVLFHEKGVTRLVPRDEIDDDPGDGALSWKLTQQLAHALDRGGIDGAARMLQRLKRKSPTTADGAAEDARALAYRLHQIADKRGDSTEAFVYNNLVTEWNKIVETEGKTAYESGDLGLETQKFGKKKKSASEGQGELF